MFSLKPPRHIPTLPISTFMIVGRHFRSTPMNGHHRRARHVGKVPTTELVASIDHLVCTTKQGERNLETERLRGLD
jgi:hypothetical protein